MVCGDDGAGISGRDRCCEFEQGRLWRVMELGTHGRPRYSQENLDLDKKLFQLPECWDAT